MITKLQVKHIQGLADKKSRAEAGEFVVEGEKLVDEVIASQWPVRALYALPSWYENHPNKNLLNKLTCHVVTPTEMARISFFKTPSPVLAVLALPNHSNAPTAQHALLVDSLQDPGNLGTIVRIADWYGIQTIYLYGPCADPWQPKCIQSSMASFLRVQIIPINNLLEIEALPYTNRFAATLHGLPPNNFFIHQPGLLMIGNESKGLNPDLQKLCTQSITIPRIGGAESLNAAVATGILCHMWIC